MLCGEFGLEDAMDLSSDNRMNEWMNEWVSEWVNVNLKFSLDSFY